MKLVRLSQELADPDDWFGGRYPRILCMGVQNILGNFVGGYKILGGTKYPVSWDIWHPHFYVPPCKIS